MCEVITFNHSTDPIRYNKSGTIKKIQQPKTLNKNEYGKIYYHNKKEQKNKEDKKTKKTDDHDYFKNYYQKNKDRYYANMHQTYKCIDCNQDILLTNKQYHHKTKEHLLNVKFNEQIEELKKQLNELKK